MTDIEIMEYLDENDWAVKANDCIEKIMNRSPQIIRTRYDSKTDTMTITTHDNVFTFRWVLNKIS